MPHLAFIFHGRIAHREKMVVALQQAFHDSAAINVYVTERAGHAVVLAEQAVQEGCTHLIAVGGDGSLNEVANGLMNAKQHCTDEVWQQIRLGVLPMGTGNDFVKTVDAPVQIDGLQEAISNDTFRAIDLGLVTYYTANGEQRQRYFVNITDVGMGGVVAERLSRYSKWMGATLTYQRAILSTLLTYRHQPVKAIADDFVYEGNVMNFVIANGKYFGSGLGIAPDAIPDDGIFALVILGEISLLDYLRHLGEVKKCRKINHPYLQYTAAKNIQITSPAGPLPIDMDGEFIGYSPLQVQVVPAALKFLCRAKK